LLAHQGTALSLVKEVDCPRKSYKGPPNAGGVTVSSWRSWLPARGVARPVRRSEPIDRATGLKWHEDAENGQRIRRRSASAPAVPPRPTCGRPVTDDRRWTEGRALKSGLCVTSNRKIRQSQGMRAFVRKVTAGGRRA